MMTNNRVKRGSVPLPRIVVALGLFAALPLAGCDEALDITDPDIVDPDQFQDETALPAVRAAALGDFHVAYTGTTGNEGVILTSGLLADEWIHSGTFPTRSEVDIRKIQSDNATVQGVTRNLYRARTSAERAVSLFEEFGANTAGHAEVLNLAGLTYTYFGEAYCSGVPFSEQAADGSFQYGGQETTQQIHERALARGDAALAAATEALAAASAGSAAEAAAETQMNLARIVRGRALVNLGRFAEAAAAVDAVPTDFDYLVRTSTNTGREQNGVYVFNVIVERWSVAANEGGSPLNFRSGDPRVGARRAGGTDVGFDNVTPQWDNLKYTSRDAPAIVANGIEARLIEAEAALQAGDLVGFLTNLNEAREPFGMTALTAQDLPAGTSGQVDLLFQERAYGLWLTAHRLGDMRRLIRQYDRSPDAVFPTGAYHKSVQGGVYGDDVNIPIFVDERNNPEFSDFPEGQLCLNRDA
jgi:tetratricopeptide (TPR) repeat protein